MSGESVWVVGHLGEEYYLPVGEWFDKSAPDMVHPGKVVGWLSHHGDVLAVVRFGMHARTVPLAKLWWENPLPLKQAPIPDMSLGTP